MEDDERQEWKSCLLFFKSSFVLHSVKTLKKSLNELKSIFQDKNKISDIKVGFIKRVEHADILEEVQLPSSSGYFDG